MSYDNDNPTAPISSPFIGDDELAELAQDIACPECGEAPVEIVRILSPEDATNESVAAFKKGLAYALGGGVAGSPLGPGGIGLGMAGGALYGSEQGRKEAKMERLLVSCWHCGHHGRAA